ncbi:hypothetical protein ABCS02_14060 [Microbacterium sp. X-17]|uniref:hypothetical protein n=1 Tax=Microbacterium sp. X-17 TaxID=3144404 RepID=UPI0031F4872A
MVEVLYASFNSFEPHIGACTCRYLGEPPETTKVLIELSVPIDMLAVDETVAALPAVDGALEVVRVLRILLAGIVVGLEDVLYAEPKFSRHQRGVRPLVVAAAVHDDADVVGV